MTHGSDPYGQHVLGPRGGDPGPQAAPPPAASIANPSAMLQQRTAHSPCDTTTNYNTLRNPQRVCAVLGFYGGSSFSSLEVRTCRSKIKLGAAE